mgnify:CR=1 FL=1
MKSTVILQIVFDVILIALFGYSGFTGETIDLFVALLWCLCLWLHIYELNRFKAWLFKSFLLLYTKGEIND